MTQLSEFGKPDLNQPSILQPAMAHQWRVIINDDKLILKQITKCSVNLLDSTFSLCIEQPVGHSHEMFSAIRALTKDKKPVAIQLLDGAGGVHSEITGFAKMISHEFLLDYSISAVATHALSFKLETTPHIEM